MSSVPSVQPDNAAFLNPALCANTERKADSKESQCQNTAGLVCGSCKLVQKTNWPHHKKICKSDLMKSEYVPGWIKQGRLPNWVSDNGLSSDFGVNQYLWGNMPAVDILNIEESESICDIHRDMDLLFAASGDIRNVVKSIMEGLSDGYDGRCTLVINDINFMVVARNAILLFVALSLEPDEAVTIMIHVWYSALLPHVMTDTLCHVALGRIFEVCEKIKDKPSTSLQAKTFSFGKRSLRLVLKKHQWDELKDYFNVPRGLTQENAQAIRRRVMLAPERVDYLHRALCNQPSPIRVATVTFREDGIILPHGASRDKFDTPNPTFFHEDRVWPMRDDADPLAGWDYHEYIKFAPKATNDVMGSFFFFLRDALLRFCKRIKDINIHFRLFNVDARELPDHLSTEESQFDRIEVSNICDRGYVGPEKILSTFSTLLKSKTINPKAILLMLFLNAVSEVYHYNDPNGKQRFNESRVLMQKFIPVTPMTLMAMMAGGASTMSSPEMIRISSCYTMFGDFEKAFGTFLKDVKMHKLTKKYGMKIKEKHSIIEPWPLVVTEKTTKEEFEIRCATTHTGCERYVDDGA
ncbi:uncharacterized protein PAC_06139 [Phialocephala subalpina]|uniref:DUF4470 domain-containing protein n=1 Tax=Phialocephala subalpina TaxID=576137 RepID=A0A1L7WU01_9HELO|nr:uncharacterized protein PAC_06139 [Phialocephala subalpina]